MTTPITVTGRIARLDPLTFTPSGIARVSFAVACSKPRKVGDTWQDGPTTFLSCTAWRHVAEAITESTGVDKGTEVTVSGELHERTWKDRNGVEQRRLEVDVRSFAVAVTGRQLVTVRRVDRTSTASTPSPLDGDPWQTPSPRSPDSSSTPTGPGRIPGDGSRAVEQARHALEDGGLLGSDVDPWAAS